MPKKTDSAVYAGLGQMLLICLWLLLLVKVSMYAFGKQETFQNCTKTNFHKGSIKKVDCTMTNLYKWNFCLKGHFCTRVKKKKILNKIQKKVNKIKQAEKKLTDLGLGLGRVATVPDNL